MYITETYKYEKDGVVFVGGNVPEGVEIIEKMVVLNAKENHTLIKISNNEDVGSSIWLRNGDVEDNYKEEEINE